MNRIVQLCITKTFVGFVVPAFHLKSSEMLMQLSMEFSCFSLLTNAYGRSHTYIPSRESKASHSG